MITCDECHQNPATVFVTKIADNQASKARLCEDCARRRAVGEGWLQHLTGQDAEVLADTPLEDIVMKLFDAAKMSTDDNDDEIESSGEEFSLSELAAFQAGEFPADEDAADAMAESFEADESFDEDEFLKNAALADEAFDEESALQSTLSSLDALLDADDLSDSNNFAPAPGPREVPVVRCAKCGTTWDRLRQDGRAGCASCYATFTEQLREVMARVQSAPTHNGKQPRAAAKRRRRLEQLRARRDHRLQMLEKRLASAIARENFEEAAKLRDKIKIVSSTILTKE